MTPPAAVAIPLVQFYSSLGLADTHIAVAFAHCMFTVPIAVWILEGFISSIPPEVDETARVDGYSSNLTPNDCSGNWCDSVFLLHLFLGRDLTGELDYHH